MFEILKMCLLEICKCLHSGHKMALSSKLYISRYTYAQLEEHRQDVSQRK